MSLGSLFLRFVVLRGALLVVRQYYKGSIRGMLQEFNKRKDTTLQGG